MNNTGIIISLAYPETIVSHAKEWYSPYLQYLGIGNKTHVRAGHAALVLIDKQTGVLEYHDFGRYIVPETLGRVRGKNTDFELDFPLIAKIDFDKIVNLKEILKFMATHPKLTHGEGTLYASVCKEIDFNMARLYINTMQEKHFIRYAAFLKDASNCARFVTDVLIASVTNVKMKKKLIYSKRFTPSTVSNVVLADTENYVYQVDINGSIKRFNTTVGKLNREFILDKLKNHIPNYKGNILPKPLEGIASHAQWLSGNGAGAWFELHKTRIENEYLIRRVLPNEGIDTKTVYTVEDAFCCDKNYKFLHHSNCQHVHIEQANKTFRFNRKD